MSPLHLLLSLFCLVYLAFAKGNEAFNRRLSRFVPCHGNLRVRHLCAWRHLSPLIAISHCRKNERKPIQSCIVVPLPSSSGLFAHDHIAIGRCAPTVLRTRAMRFRVGQRAASRLGADLHAKRLEKLETLYPLCEGFLQKSTLTISGRTFRRTLVLSSSQTSKPPNQRHRYRLYHL